MSIVHSQYSPGPFEATKQSATRPPRRGAWRVLAFALAVAALSSSAHAASGTWTNLDANNVWQDNNNWSASPFPGGTAAAFTSTDTATFSTTGSGIITLGGTGIINVQTIFFGSGAGNANAFTLGAATDTFELTGSGTNATGGVILGAGVTTSEQMGVAGTTINVSATNTNFDNASTTAGVTLTVAGNIGQTGTNTTNLFFGADGANGVGGAVNVTGTITNSSSNALTIFKRDQNTATLSGPVTTGNGAINVRNGTLTLNGATNTGTAGIAVQQGTGASSASATLNIAANVSSLNLAVQAGLATTSGAVYQTAGTVAFSQGAGSGNFQVGAIATPGQNFSGYYKLSGGSLTANEFDIGGLFAASVGVMDVTGGTATTNGYLTIGRGTTTSSGLVNVTGGTVNTGATAGATGPIALNWGTTTGAQAVLNVGGGPGAAAVTGSAGTTATGQFAGLGLNLAESNIAGTQGIANLLTNGTLTVTDVVASQGATSTSQLNFNGGTLKATATNLGANFLTSTNISAINVFSGGGTIDNNSTGITISHALVAPIGQGVSGSSVTVASGGSGYIGAPLVKLTGGTGTGATGYATISGGAVTGIVITSPGIGYTAGDTLTATFFGGVGNSGTAATSVTGIAVAANTSGGLTFQGTGTTTLTGANTYTGITTISAGALQLGAAGTTGSLSSSSNVVDNGSFIISRTNAVAQGTDFGNVISGTGTLTVTGGTLTLGSSNTYGGQTSINGGENVTVTSFNHFASGSIGGGATTTTPAPSSSLGVPSSAANNVLNLGGGGLAGTVTYTGAGEVTDKSINLGGGFGTPNGVITQAGTGLLEFTGNVTAIVAAKTLVLQGSTAGTGQIAGTISDASGTNFISLQKAGTGTWTLSNTNTFSGGTTVSGGILALAANGALGAGSATVATTATSLTIRTGVTAPFAAGSATTLTLAGGGTPGVADVGYLDLTSGATITVNGLVLGTTTEPAGVYTAALDPDYISGTGSVIVAPVPEPSAWALLLAGLVAVGGLVARRPRRA